MREVSSIKQLTQTKDYAAYTLFATSAPSVGAPSKTVTLGECLSAIASRSKPHAIGVSIKQRFGPSARFSAHFKRQCEQASPTFERARAAGLIENGRAKGWVLAAVEVEPAALRFHYVSNAQWRKHRAEIDKYRSAHPEEAARMTNEAIVAALGLAPYHETLAFHSPNPVSAVQSTIFEFHVARDDGTGHDAYTVKVQAYDIVIVEPVGLAQCQLIIPNEADPANYTATIIDIQ